MSKIYSPDSVFIQDVTILKRIETQYNVEQYFQFICRMCGSVAKRKLYKIKKNEYMLYCITCLSKQTCLKKYGAEHPWKNPVVREKIKQTNLKKYGVDNPFKNEQIKEKIQQTNIEKYGVKNPRQSKEIQEKYKQTCIDRYGVDSFSKTKVFKEKITQTSLWRFGTVWPTQCQLIKRKTRDTLLQRYGTIFTPRKKDSYKKQKETMVWKYGRYPAPKVVYKKDGQFFDSSWELAVWIWAMETGKQIKREPISFEYEFEGKEHLYYPDFDIDGQLVEVKGPQFFNKKGEMQNPYDHSLDGLFEAKHQCGIKHNVQFWAKQEMQPVLDYMKLAYGSHWKNKFKNKNSNYSFLNT